MNDDAERARIVRRASLAKRDESLARFLAPEAASLVVDLGISGLERFLRFRQLLGRLGQRGDLVARGCVQLGLVLLQFLDGFLLLVRPFAVLIVDDDAVDAALLVVFHEESGVIA